MPPCLALPLSLTAFISVAIGHPRLLHLTIHFLKQSSPIQTFVPPLWFAPVMKRTFSMAWVTSKSLTLLPRTLFSTCHLCPLPNPPLTYPKQGLHSQVSALPLSHTVLVLLAIQQQVSLPLLSYSTRFLQLYLQYGLEGGG